MPYILMPRPRVEALGAVFVFGSTDAVMTDLVQEVQRLKASGVDVTNVKMEDAPPGLLEPLVALFVDCVEEWEGVLDAAGEPVPCTPEMRARFPLTDKLLVATAYFEQWQELEGNAPPSDAPPTIGTPDGSE